MSFRGTIRLSNHNYKRVGLSSHTRWNAHQSRSFTTETQRIKKPKYRAFRSVFEECIARNDLSQTDWYHQSPEKLLTVEASQILETNFKGSMYTALSTLFPETDWFPYKFKNERLPQHYWKDPSKQRIFFDNIGKELGIKSLDDWYEKISQDLVREHGGGKLLELHNGSAVKALLFSYPEHNWIVWKFNMVPHGFWNSVENQRKYFDWLGNQIGIKTLDDWYEKLSQDIIQEYGASVLRIHKHSPFEAIQTAYPEHNWIPWKFNSAPRGFWKSIENQRKYFDWLGKELGIQRLDDWYEKISSKVLVQHSGGRLLEIYNGSSSEALKAAYPEHNWITWKFSSVSKGYWQSQDNQRQFLADLGKELGASKSKDMVGKLSRTLIRQKGGAMLLQQGPIVQTLQSLYPQENWEQWWDNQKVDRKEKRIEQAKQTHKENVAELKAIFQNMNLTEQEWYQLSPDNLEPRAAEILKSDFDRSLYNALCLLFPQTEWYSWKFKNYNVPSGFWESAANQRKFLDDLGKQIGIQSVDDWYQKATCKLIESHGGRGLVQLHRTPFSILKAAYPEHNWVPWKFSVVYPGCWQNVDNIRQFLSELSEKLSIQTLDDWYRVDFVQLRQLGARSLLARFKGIYGIVKYAYPNHPWDPKKFKLVGKKGQRWMAVVLKKMFPGEEIMEDYLHPRVKLPSSHRYLQLDVFIPSKNLAFEYQGKQHYQDIGFFAPAASYQQRDEEKRILCAANNIKLIEVPYWWNRTQEELKDIIDKSVTTFK